MNILIVDDSALIRSILKQVLLSDDTFKLAGEASNGHDAIAMNDYFSPDLIIMDINMPKMNGLEATRAIMEKHPVPIVIFSSEVDADSSFEAINNGAVDIIKKPNIAQFNELEFINRFKGKLIAAGVSKIKKEEPHIKNAAGTLVRKNYEVIVIGSSTGGPSAVRDILRSLPRDLSVPLFLVQHLEAGFEKSFVHWLDNYARISVVLAEDMMPIEPGKLFVAPVGKHLVLRDKVMRLDDSPEILFQKPSVDLLFKSAADYFKDKVIGIQLTGMGRDGAEGCKAIIDNKGFTVVQDEESSTIFGMPKAAIELQAASTVLHIKDISGYVLELLGRKE